MSITKIKWHWIAGIIFIALFGVLFSIRLGLFQKAVPENIALSTSEIPIFVPKETWMNITQNRRKIGYSHREFTKTNQGYQFSESVFMRINTMGVVQPMQLNTEGNLKPDMSLASFTFSLQSSIFNFQVRGITAGEKLILYTGTQNHQTKTEITLAKLPHLANNILDVVSHENLTPGQSRTLHVFDPAFMGERPVKVSVLAREMMLTKGKLKRTKKISIDFMGTQQYAWIGDDGTVIKEQGILGITLEQVSQKEALSGFSSSTSDLTEIASIPANKIIDNPSSLKELQVKLINADKQLYLNGGRQTIIKDVLTIHKEVLAGPIKNAERLLLSDTFKPFLAPSPFIQSDNVKIRRQVEKIINPSDTDDVKADKLVRWIYKNIAKRPVLSVPNALDTLNNRVGDCNEHAALLTAMARAAGIPAQIEAGLIYQKGKFYYHAWNVLYLGKWITADAVFSQFPADVTHIRLVRGSQENQIDLLSSIGRLKIHIEAYQ